MIKQQKNNSNRIVVSTSLAICLGVILVASLWLAVNPAASVARFDAQTLHPTATDWMKSPNNPVLQPGEPGQPVELRISVNYAHDWAYVNAEAHTTVTITVESADGAIYNAIGDTDNDGHLRSWQLEWQPEHPNIQPGDTVIATSAAETTAIDPIGEIAGTVDADLDTVVGTIHAPWFAPGTLTVRCEVWVEGGPEPIEIEGVAADGGTYECDFSGIWDITAHGDVSVTYEEPDGDEVINVFGVPWMRVNYSHDWVGGNYPAGHMFDITVTDDSGNVKATVQIASAPGRGWGGDGFSPNEEDWTPMQPDIEPGDRVRFLSDDGYDNTIEVGEVNGDLDINADSVGGTIHAAWFSPALLRVECHIWEEAGPDSIEIIDVAADGGSYLCDFSGQWDILPGHQVAVMYLEPDGDRVINVFEGATPDVRVEKWVEGSGQVMPGGPVVYTIRYGNDGEAVAETITLTDTLPADTVYVDDTSGATPDVDDGKVVWTLEALPPGEHRQFQLELINSAEAGDTLRNEAEIYTLYDRNEDNNYIEAEAQVSEGQPDLYVSKHILGHDPTPGQTFLYRIDYGNQDAVASGAVTLTDTLPAGTSVVSWHSGNDYSLWTEISTDSEHFVLQAPSIPGHWGDSIELRLLLDEGVEFDTQLINSVEIVTEDDANPDNNVHTTENYVNEAYTDAGIYKNFGNGRLIPDGDINYNVNFHNHGNTAVDAVVTDILPEGVSFVEACRHQPSACMPYPPDSADTETLVWNLGILEPGEGYEFNIRLRIDNDIAPDTMLTNCAEIIIATDDYNPDNNRTCTDDAVRTPGSNLRIEKEVWWQNGDQQLEYRIDIENVGTTTLDQVTVTDIYPDSTMFNGDWWHEFWEGVDFEQDDANRQLMWTFERLEPNWSTNIGFRVDVDGDVVGVQGLTFTNTVEVPVADDVYHGDNTATAVIYSGPDFFAEKWVSDGEILPGERITFTVRFGNATQWPWEMSDETSPRLIERLPVGMTFVEALVARWQRIFALFHDPATGLVIWEDERLGGNDRRTFYLVVDLDDDLEPGDMLINTLEITQVPATDIDPIPDNNTFTYSIKIPTEDIYLPMLLH